MTDEVKSRKRTQGVMPNKEADMISIAASVASVWEARPELKLIWTTPAGLKEATGLFKASFAVRNETKSSRVAITMNLRTINAEINESVRHVKNYIAELSSTKDAPSYYPQFGMVKENGVYRMPVDNDKRLYALEQMVKAINRHGLADRKYGKQYWEDIYTRFAGIKKQAAGSDSTSAEHVSIKTGQKTTIRKTLNALIWLIKANYPDTWKEELRVWGFQKEKY